MKLIEPKVELIEEENLFKKIEIAGRTCYKSEANITDESALKFYNNLVKHGHFAMLEHATVAFLVEDDDIYQELLKYKYLNATNLYGRRIVSGNIRAINETNNCSLITALFNYNEDLAYNKWCVVPSANNIEVINLSEIFSELFPDEIREHCYFTLRFTCDRGVSHELVRHRPASYAQESTRYVNYSKEKFGNGDIKFIIPADYDNWADVCKDTFNDALVTAEANYNKLIENGATPQEARAVLPNAVKTEILFTANVRELNHFFELRYFGTTGAPHPDMQKVAKMAYNLIDIDTYCLTRYSVQS